MKSKLVFRILGALASALIIVSVFIPFVSVTGYSQSLWQAHESVGTLYLPIMIIAFGVIGVLVFSTNFKTELAYASAGGLVFFLIMKTIPIVDQGTFNTLSVGYYCLAVGTVLIIIMAFLCGLKVKQKVVAQKVQETKEVSMIDQIDRLYNDQAINEPLSNTNGLDNIIQPIPVGSSMPINPIPMENPVQIQAVPENSIQPVVAASEPMNAPVSLQNLGNQVSEPAPILEVPTQVSNASTTNVETSVPNVVTPSSTPVISEFNVPIQNDEPQSNPVVAEFSQSAPVAPQQATIQGNPVVAEFSQSAPVAPQQASTQGNPVVAEFSQSTPVAPQQPSVPEVPTIEPIQPISSEKKVDVMAEPTNNSSNLDIFG